MVIFDFGVVDGEGANGREDEIGGTGLFVLVPGIPSPEAGTIGTSLQTGGS